MKSHRTERPEKKEQYFEIGFLLRGETEWGSGHTLATDEQSAIRNFLSDFSPSMGVIVGLYAFGNDEVSRQVLEKLHPPVAA